MRIGDCFPAKYLRATDIPAGREVTVEIGNVVLEEIGDSEERGVVYFAQKHRGLVLNRTNAEVIAAAYGDETDAWAGLPLILFQSMTFFRGRQVPCLRVRVPASAPAPPPPPPSQGIATDQPVSFDQIRGEAPASDQTPGDDIPF